MADDTGPDRPDGTATAQVPGGADEAPSAAERRLDLLWRPAPPTGRGRPPRFTTAQVVDAGIAVAQESGLEALSMRRVAAHLGVGAMSLYTYVPGRTELIDLMIDRAFGELTLPAPDLPWREALELYAREQWALYLRHPWLLETNGWRLPLAPNVMAAEEAGYRTIIDTGLTAAQVVDTLGLLNAFVQGVARIAVAERREQDASGLSYGEYWASLNVFWEKYFDGDRYPTMVRIWNAGAFDTAGTPFDLRLGRLLDGIALTVERAGVSEAGRTEPAPPDAGP